MSKYNTNLASEFHVLSMLHRLGLDAVLTLGNKKMVDIVVTSDEGELITIDVKGIEKNMTGRRIILENPKEANISLFS